MECGASSYLDKHDILMQDPAGTESKLLDQLLFCPICGGQLSLVDKARDESFYRFE